MGRRKPSFRGVRSRESRRTENGRFWTTHQIRPFLTLVWLSFTNLLWLPIATDSWMQPNVYFLLDVDLGYQPCSYLQTLSSRFRSLAASPARLTSWCARACTASSQWKHGAPASPTWLWRCTFSLTGCASVCGRLASGARALVMASSSAERQLVTDDGKGGGADETERRYERGAVVKPAAIRDSQVAGGLVSCA